MEFENCVVSWKCGKCDVMHTQEFTDERAGEVLVLVAMIVMAEDNPHLTVSVTRNGCVYDETTPVLLATTVAVINGEIG